VRDLPAGWLIPVVIMIILSFPPLFGQEIIALLCGVVYGLWIGFAIVAAGTFIGEGMAFQRLVLADSLVVLTGNHSRHLVRIQIHTKESGTQIGTSQSQLRRYGAYHSRRRLLGTFTHVL
jgi:hypothetical protein